MIDLLDLLTPPLDDPGGDVGDPPIARAPQPTRWPWPDLLWWLR